MCLCVYFSCPRCERRELQFVPEPRAAERLADIVSGELQTQLRTWGHRHGGRSYTTLRSSLQILSGEEETLLLLLLLKCWNVSLWSASVLWRDFEKRQTSQQLFPFWKFCSWGDFKCVDIMRLVCAFQQYPYVNRSWNDRAAEPHHHILTIYFSSTQKKKRKKENQTLMDSIWVD